MYQIQFGAVSGSDWAQSIQIIDANTNLPITGIDDALIELDVKDSCGATLLTATTADGSIERPDFSTFQWHFPYADLGALCAGHTYKVGCRLTTSAGTISIFVGSLAFTNGVVS